LARELLILLFEVILRSKHTLEVVTSSKQNLAVGEELLVILQLENDVVEVNDRVKSDDLSKSVREVAT
jgi:hypothetical protein